MGYTDLDQLAINTIRILAVCPLAASAKVLQVQLEGLFASSAHETNCVAT
jgi:hypothetical protein